MWWSLELARWRRAMTRMAIIMMAMMVATRTWARSPESEPKFVSMSGSRGVTIDSQPPPLPVQAPAPAPAPVQLQLALSVTPMWLSVTALQLLQLLRGRLLPPAAVQVLQLSHQPPMPVVQLRHSKSQCSKTATALAAAVTITTVTVTVAPAARVALAAAVTLSRRTGASSHDFKL